MSLGMVSEIKEDWADQSFGQETTKEYQVLYGAGGGLQLCDRAPPAHAEGPTLNPQYAQTGTVELIWTSDLTQHKAQCYYVTMLTEAQLGSMGCIFLLKAAISAMHYNAQKSRYRKHYIQFNLLQLVMGRKQLPIIWISIVASKEYTALEVSVLSMPGSAQAEISTDVKKLFYTFLARAQLPITFSHISPPVVPCTVPLTRHASY